jgi:hypothetical protein
VFVSFAAVLSPFFWNNNKQKNRPADGQKSRITTPSILHIKGTKRKERAEHPPQSSVLLVWDISVICVVGWLTQYMQRAETINARQYHLEEQHHRLTI